MFTGFLGLIIFCADIYAILNVVKSSSPTDKKILWCLLVIVLPVIGLIIWYAAGPKSSSLR
jgi:hypothetical protein